MKRWQALKQENTLRWIRCTTGQPWISRLACCALKGRQGNKVTYREVKQTSTQIKGLMRSGYCIHWNHSSRPHHRNRYSHESCQLLRIILDPATSSPSSDMPASQSPLDDGHASDFSVPPLLRLNTPFIHPLFLSPQSYHRASVSLQFVSFTLRVQCVTSHTHTPPMTSSQQLAADGVGGGEMRGPSSHPDCQACAIASAQTRALCGASWRPRAADLVIARR